MQKITLIIGPRESGKSFLAHNIESIFKNPVLYSGRGFDSDSSFVFSEVDEETDLIIIDDIPKNEVENKILCLFPSTIIINKRFAEIIEIARPKIIVTCELTMEELSKFNFGPSFYRRVDIIDTSYENGIFTYSKVSTAQALTFSR